MQYNIAPSATSRTNAELSHNHVSTIDFNQILPVQSTDCIIGDEHHVEITPFIRLAPLAVPTYGRFNLRLVSFFVPYYQVFKDFDSFYTGLSSVGGTLTSQLPYIDLYTLYLELLTTTDATLIEGDINSSTQYDIAIQVDALRVRKYRLGKRSKQIFKILSILGYPPTSLIAPGLPGASTTQLNALPILCFLKGFNDWLSLSSTYSNSVLTAFLKNPTSPRPGLSSTMEVNEYNLIKVLFEYVYPLIGSDYFTSAYNFALSAQQSSDLQNSDVFSSSFLDKLRGSVTENVSELTATKDFTSLTVPEENQSVSQYNLNFLRAFDRFVRRNQLAGTRAAQRIYAAFGLKSEDFRSNYAHIINTASIPFQVGDVTSTAANADPALGLGTYAGQSIATGKYSFDYKCDDFGFLFTIAFVEVRAQYKCGISPTVLKSSYLDFYQPDFDGVGLAPISRSQLFTYPKTFTGAENDSGAYVIPSSNMDKVFGFVPRYEEYRTEVDKVSGDFMLFDSMDSWHFGRNFDYLKGDRPNNDYENILPQSNDFQFVGTEFDRIFTTDVNDNVNSYDHFFCIFNIEHKAVRPIKSRAGSIDFQDGQIQLQSLGKSIQEM